MHSPHLDRLSAPCAPDSGAAVGATPSGGKHFYRNLLPHTHTHTHTHTTQHIQHTYITHTHMWYICMCILNTHRPHTHAPYTPHPTYTLTAHTAHTYITHQTHTPPIPTHHRHTHTRDSFSSARGRRAPEIPCISSSSRKRGDTCRAPRSHQMALNAWGKSYIFQGMVARSEVTWGKRSVHCFQLTAGAVESRQAQHF